MDFVTRMSLTILIVVVLGLCFLSYHLFLERAALRSKLDNAQRAVRVQSLHVRTRARIQAITDYHHMAQGFDESLCIAMLKEHVKTTGVRVVAITAIREKAFLPEGYVRMNISYLIGDDVDLCNLDINERQLQAWAKDKHALYRA